MQRPDYSIPKVIAASAVGTMIEWYDFYIFGSLATVISPLFYPQGNETLTSRKFAPELIVRQSSLSSGNAAPAAVATAAGT